jgi:8-oxo-dGTP pyrophosphatase MutT (NUDIX family)
MSHPETPVQTLAAFLPRSAEDQALYPGYLAFAHDPAHALRERSTEQHLTASAFVFDAALESVLLCFHRKGRFWVQLGGHIEASDASLAAAALREAEEESGLEELTPLRPTPVDLDRHALSAGFGTCKVHWDVGYAFTAARAVQPVASDESESVAWWPLAALPEGCVDGLTERIGRVVDSLRADPTRGPGGAAH